MNSTWTDALLGELCGFRAGGAFPRAEQGLSKGDIPFIKVSDMNLSGNSKKIRAANHWVSFDTAQRLKAKPVDPGAVVFAKIGEALKAERLRVLTMPTLIDNNMMAAIARPGVDPSFLYFLLETVHLAQWAEGSALPYLRQGDLERIPVRVPGLQEQRGIAKTLGALDDKIDSNVRAVALIEALVTLEFRRTTSTEGTTSVPLSELASITKGVSYKSVDLLPSRTSLVTLKSFHRKGGYKPRGLKPYVGAYKPSQEVLPGDIVVAQTDLTQGAEVVGRAVRVPADPSADVLVASLDLVIVRPVEDLSAEYLQGILTDEAFRQYCRSRTNGTTVLHLASDAIPAYAAPIVAEEAQREFSRFVRPLIERADSLNRETAKLSLLRDALLPELLSGRKVMVA
jgi:type I restriction enzyme S subunit